MRKFKPRLPVHTHSDGLLLCHRKRIQEGRLHDALPHVKSIRIGGIPEEHI